MAAGKEEPTLAEFLAPGVEPQDLPELFPRLRAFVVEEGHATTAEFSA